MTSSIAMKDFYPLTKQEDLAIIDVREAYEYQMGHVPDAKNVPLSTLGDSVAELELDKEYYLICQSGARSENACAFLSGQGYRITNILGGTSAWPGTLTR
ncbi:rhodanese-like domain-containing protein [Candidatus Enterococcus murrayae]|uniref:Rhodanese-like domain-containing protein n=1 Tax=Candidatus Enterococcus murrayae TaxID=2815321 RepID=A0ABS3HES8_9ENTE|nr:rhodanese-like domain-containing protein [Enterococcus sp. MJM16]MBO0451961.1 rhodanese-like domain-containing protein [Enterococcus sp. MJM16]